MGFFDIFRKSKQLVCAHNQFPSEELPVDLDSMRDRYSRKVFKIGDCIEVYCYTRVPIVDVYREELANMVACESYNLAPVLTYNGSIALLHDGVVVAHLGDRLQMCKDWMKRGDPIRCEVTGFRTGSEHVVLAFYRNEEARLSAHESFIVKLTSYSSGEKQDTICGTMPMEKLVCEEDCEADGKVNVTDTAGAPLGRLPKKYADMFFDDGFAGIFFDHYNENDEGKLIPFVKIYCK